MADQLVCDIAFSLAKGIHGDTALEMLKRVGSTADFATLPSKQLAMMAGVESPIFDDIYRRQLLDQAQNEAVFVRQNSIEPLFIGSSDYPRRLANCSDAPTMLYKLGKCDLDCAHAIGIVGTRHATVYGIEFTKRLVKDLAEKLPGLVVVSGLAFGIDAAAHNAALAASVPTVGVLAHGLNRIYPAEHRSLATKMLAQGGALATEYTPNSEMHRSNFLARNRIIAGLCDCVLIVESDQRGGAMSTARLALQYDREVFAVPGRISDTYSRGTNRLIADNMATLITCADDIIAAMQWVATQTSAPSQPALFKPLTPLQQQVYDCLIDNEQLTANELCVRLDIPFATLSNVLFQLEMSDLIISMPGSRYAILNRLKP